MPLIRALPIPILPLPGETVTGFSTRLAIANALPPSDLRLHILHLGNLSLYKKDLESAEWIIERLAGLRPGYFAAELTRHHMYVRCGHGQGYIPRCRPCHRVQAPRSECQWCSRGVATTTRRRGGAVCLRHGRWRLDGRDSDVRGMPEYARAERWLAGPLWVRGLGIQTGETDLSARLIQAALRDEGTLPPALDRRAAALRVDWRRSLSNVFLIAYPEIVALTALLVHPEFLTYLLSPRYRAQRQVEIVSATVAGVLRSSGGRGLEKTAEILVSRSQDAVMEAYGARSTFEAVYRRAPLEKALASSARSNRACLLRHLDMVRIPPGWEAATSRVPSPYRVVHRTPYRADRLADPDDAAHRNAW